MSWVELSLQVVAAACVAGMIYSYGRCHGLREADEICGETIDAYKAEAERALKEAERCKRENLDCKHPESARVFSACGRYKVCGRCRQVKTLTPST